MIFPPVRPQVLGLSCKEFTLCAQAAFALPEGKAKGGGVALKVYRNLFRLGRPDWSALGLSERARHLWEGSFDWKLPLQTVQVARDEPDQSGSAHAAKAVFALADGARIETVLVPMENGEGGRSSLCISSQVGCAMGCAFCETGRPGLWRNLSAAEIVAQVHQARFELGWEFSNLVFMGMGEPLDNCDQVMAALEVLMDHDGFAFAQERITLCTVGVPEGIRALAARGWKRMGLSLSLNAATQALRERIMPVSRAWDLDALALVFSQYRPRSNFVLALNYCLLPGINDSLADAQAVADFAARIGRVLVNVIPYNPGTQPIAETPAPEEIDAFMDRLKALKVPARIRGPKGRSIMAACGQLGGKGGQ